MTVDMLGTRRAKKSAYQLRAVAGRIHHLVQKSRCLRRGRQIGLMLTGCRTNNHSRMPPFQGKDMSLLPRPTFTNYANLSNSWTLQFAPGTRLDCFRYANGTTFSKDTTCEHLAEQNGVSVLNLQDWNPYLKGDGCKGFVNGQNTYCVQVSELKSTDMASACVVRQTPDGGNSCEDFVKKWSLNMEDFLEWNPSVGTNCTKWSNGSYLVVRYRHALLMTSRSCVLHWGSTLSATWHRCELQSICRRQCIRQYVFTARGQPYGADSRIVDGSRCTGIEQRYGLTHGRFVAWNPAVKKDCKFCA